MVEVLFWIGLGGDEVGDCKRGFGGGGRLVGWVGGANRLLGWVGGTGWLLGWICVGGGDIRGEVSLQRGGFGRVAAAFVVVDVAVGGDARGVPSGEGHVCGEEACHHE